MFISHDANNCCCTVLFNNGNNTSFLWVYNSTKHKYWNPINIKDLHEFDTWFSHWKAWSQQKERVERGSNKNNRPSSFGVRSLGQSPPQDPLIEMYYASDACLFLHSAYRFSSSCTTCVRSQDFFYLCDTVLVSWFLVTSYGWRRLGRRGTCRHRARQHSSIIFHMLLLP